MILLKYISKNSYINNYKKRPCLPWLNLKSGKYSLSQQLLHWGRGNGEVEFDQF